jgi:glycerol-3-phosphate acyltransferase PlsY
MTTYLVFILAYFLGAIPFAYLAGRLRQIDVRKEGSGNIGTTNAFRLLGAKLGIAVLVGDILKGVLAAGLTYHYFGPWGGIIGGFLAMAGHSWNPFFGFKPSGKGVATGCGIILVLMPQVALIAALVFVVMVYATRYVSVGSLTAAVAVAIAVFVFPEPWPYRLFGLVAAAVVIVRHRTNIQRLLQGTENRVGQKKAG